MLRDIIAAMNREVFALSNKRCLLILKCLIDRPLRKRLLPGDQKDYLNFAAEEEEGEKDRMLIEKLLNEDRRRLQEELDKKTYERLVFFIHLKISMWNMLRGLYYCRSLCFGWLLSQVLSKGSLWMVIVLE